ncbi:MAG: carbon-nitrogen hydrolase family protein [bacterium]|nr:carbon-nitrogen hydrolase family protein [bacterium]
MHRTLILTVVFVLAGSATAADLPEHDGWKPFAIREEIRPEFSVKPDGGPDGAGGLVIRLGQNDGEDGAWRKEFPVTGGMFYRLTAHRSTANVPLLWRNTYVELLFTDDRGNLVTDETTNLKSRPFYLPEPAAGAGAWTKLSDTFRAPLAATQAVVELRLRWVPAGVAEYGAVRLEETTAPGERKARLAAVHYIPRNGKSSMDNCRQFAPYIAEAARQRADLVVLGEAVTLAGRKVSYEEVSEPIPGPSTEYFGQLADEHNLYIVVGLFERDRRLIYNTSALLGPDGELIGKYRKVAPARDEMRQGVMPGSEYPVFDTRFGKVGMMICFDNFMPEVARNLTLNGAEVIAMPVWGGDPTLARANAIFNQVFVVSSTYTTDKTWMRTGIWDKEGRLAAVADDWGQVVVHEVDLNHRHIRRANLGDFRGRIRVQRPLNPVER